MVRFYCKLAGSSYQRPVKTHTVEGMLQPYRALNCDVRQKIPAWIICEIVVYVARAVFCILSDRARESRSAVYYGLEMPYNSGDLDESGDLDYQADEWRSICR